MRPYSFILLFSFLVYGCATLPQPRETLTSSGKFEYAISGNGSITVLFEAGLGDRMTSWSEIFSEISKSTRVFAYSRSGYGSSKSVNHTRDVKTIISELRTLLDSVNIRPPYLLVGHSLGGTYMEYFARNFPQEVTGVILIDSRHSEFVTNCVERDASFCDSADFLSPFFDELKDINLTNQELKDSPQFPDVPLVVITSMDKPFFGEKFRQAWLETQTDLALLSTLSKHIVCSKCGHYVHQDRPEIIIEAINWVLDESRKEDSGYAL